MSKIKRQIKVIYTPEQLDDIRRKKFELDKEIHILKKEFEAVKESHKMEIKPVEVESKQLFMKLFDGYEFEERLVEEYFDHETKTVEYYDGETLVDKRPMSASEIQQYILPFQNRKAV